MLSSGDFTGDFLHEENPPIIETTRNRPITRRKNCLRRNLSACPFALRIRIRHLFGEAPSVRSGVLLIQFYSHSQLTGKSLLEHLDQ